MTFVKGQQAASSEPLGEDRNGQIRETEIKVRVMTIELERVLGAVGTQSGSLEAALGKVSQKGTPCMGAEPFSEEVVDLGGYWRRDEKPTRLGSKQLEDPIT